LLMWTAL